MYMYPRQVYSEHIVSQCDECCVGHVGRPAILLSSHNLKQHTPLPIAKDFFSDHLRPTMRWTFRPYRDAAARLVCVEPHFLNKTSRLVSIPEYTYYVHNCSMVFFNYQIRRILLFYQVLNYLDYFVGISLIDLSTGQ